MQNKVKRRKMSNKIFNPVTGIQSIKKLRSDKKKNNRVYSKGSKTGTL